VDADGAREVANEIDETAASGDAMALECDLTDRQDVSDSMDGSAMPSAASTSS